MAGAYKRKQLLLRREDGTPGGFVRVEQAGLRCTVEVMAKGVPTNARAVLLGAHGDAPLSLGDLVRGAGSFTLRTEQAEGYTQAAVLAGDTTVLVGGEGAVFSEIRSRLTRRKYAPKPVTAEPERAERGSGAEGPAHRNAARASAAPVAEGQAAPWEGAPQSAAPESPAAAPRAARGLPPYAEPSRFADGTGWIFTPHRIPGAPERISGRLIEDGRVKAVLHGVAGMYAPEPPPGLIGYAWDAGFWVRVETGECS